MAGAADDAKCQDALSAGATESPEAGLVGLGTGSPRAGGASARHFPPREWAAGVWKQPSRRSRFPEHPDPRV